MCKLLITGAAGYVGSLLCRGLLRADPGLEIVALDLNVPDQEADPRVQWIQGDVTERDWHKPVAARGIDAVVHLAFLLREPYGDRARQRRVNVDGTRMVRDFALATPGVGRFVHFSTVSVYADVQPRGMDEPLDEEAAPAYSAYSYARDKVDVEAIFAAPELFDRYDTRAVVLRPASITGPYGRFERRRFGLISTLSAWSPFIFGGSRRFGRQFLHEDDVVGIVRKLLTVELNAPVTVLNAAPDDFLDLERLSGLLNKRAMVVPPALMRVMFRAAWHGSAGRVPTSPGSWMMLTYPHRVRGDRLTQLLDYRYRASSAEALAGCRLEAAASATLAAGSLRAPLHLSDAPQTR